MTTALVILAAGIGARYGGGVKQLAPVGPGGELIIDYSVHDALCAGFNKIIFIIRRDIEKDFKEVIGNRIEALCQRLGAEVAYAFQDLADIPSGQTVPEERKKPWGTGQALLSCRDILREPFAIINADDYYGKTAFRLLYDFLTGERKPMELCMAGFRLGNTLSENGGVTRGVCQVSPEGYLEKVTETRNIIPVPNGVGAKLPDGGMLPLELNAVVSMNMWGMGPEVMPAFAAGFRDFFRDNHENLTTTEFLIPVFVDQLLRRGEASVKMLPTADRWFGITYREDTPAVQAAFRDLIAGGEYGVALFEDIPDCCPGRQ